MLPICSRTFLPTVIVGSINIFDNNPNIILKHLPHLALIIDKIFQIKIILINIKY